jgi:hypothetical protein
VAQLSLSVAFEGTVLLDACRATFTHRETAVSSDRRPPPLGPRFYLQAGRSVQWNELARENPALGGLGSFREVGEQVISFLGPGGRALVENTAMDAAWEPPGPWKRDQHLEDP